MKRSAPSLMAALGLATLAASSPALATPTITSFKLSAPAPIPGVPGTGKLGAGAVLAGSTSVAGTEYGGSPEPLVGLTLLGPPGMQVHPGAFAKCPLATLEQRGPQACPRHSIAGPGGTALGDVTIAGERVPERVSVQLFVAPGNGLAVFIDGRSPVLIEIVAHGHEVPATPPFGLQFVGEIPPIVTLPGALDASFLEGTVKVGAGYRQGGRAVSYVTLPRRCPRSGWTFKEQLRFLGGGEASATGRMPCPAR
jgi:hypothetical protein